MPRRKNGDNSVPKRVTLQDIADVAGVHRMTVSDALNGTGSVAVTTRAKIREIAKELNYIPNFAARALSTGRTGMIAVISGKVNEQYYGNMVHLLEKEISNDGYHLMLMRTPKEVKELVNATGNVAVDGAVVVDMWGMVDEFRAHPTIPCVAVSTYELSFVDCVIADLRPSVEEAVETMLRAGRQRVGYITTSSYMSRESEVRAGAYAETMRRSNKPVEIINLLSDDVDIVAQRFREYVQEKGCPDGILCQNDDIAMCIFSSLHELGLRVPEDTLLVGCDGQLHMKYFNPPLSTIEQPVEEMCALAWKFLRNRMRQPGIPHQQAEVAGRLVVRKSLGF